MPSSSRLPRLVLLLREFPERATASERVRDADLDGLVHLAFEQRVLPALGAVLIRQGADPVPSQLALFLSQQAEPLSARHRALVAHAVNEARNADLLQQLARSLTVLRARGISVIPLKGAAILEADPEVARELTDVDLLVTDASRIDEARDVLLGDGYRDTTSAEYQQETVLPDEHQLRPLVRDGRAGSIELHRSVLQTEYDRLFSVTFARQHTMHTGADERLTPFALALHSIIHNRVVDNSYRRLDPGLRSVLDVIWCARRDPTTPEQLLQHATANPGLVRRSIRASLLLARMIAPELKIPAPRVRERWWWFQVRALYRVPRLRGPFAALALLPFSLRRERMEARAGHPLSAAALLAARIRFLGTRSARYARDGV